ncbi:MAG: MotA/TolQ/ExbB proton channel family protein [Clostridiales Family XIII bacterium]|jgi:biopolymer transport protein ExbB/TolQ|nr:MotA/TolQ/ExbB proton channel family protein [Clostridiales Family XIII bacterium]
MLATASVKSAIHWISAGLEVPAIIVLILFVAIVAVELGSLAAEAILRVRRGRVDVKGIVKGLKGQAPAETRAVLQNTAFPAAQKKAFAEILENKGCTQNTAHSLAVRLLAVEEGRCQKIVTVTDVISRIGPLFGLMATLIPLGPGLIALGQGDTKTLSDSLLTAFDATVAGLAAAGVAFVISRIRKRWYEDGLVTMETVLEAMLEEYFPEERRQPC